MLGCEDYSLRVTSTRNELLLFVHKPNRGIRKRLANYKFEGSQPNTPSHNISARKLQVTRTLVTSHLSADDVADLAAGGKVSDYTNEEVGLAFLTSLNEFNNNQIGRGRVGQFTTEISRNARSEETARRNGQGAAEIGHASEGAAVEDVEAVL